MGVHAFGYCITANRRHDNNTNYFVQWTHTDNFHPHIPSDLTSSHQALSFNPPPGLTRLEPSASHVSLSWMYRRRLQQAPSHSACTPCSSSHPPVFTAAQGTRSFCGVSYPFLFILFPYCSPSDHSLRSNLSIVLEILTCHSNSSPTVPRSVWSDPMSFLHPLCFCPPYSNPLDRSVLQIVTHALLQIPCHCHVLFFAWLLPCLALWPPAAWLTQAPRLF